MEITVKNCNAIDLANVNIQENRLNIKYGPNGIGKSTFTRAIELSTSDKNNGLKELLPFKYIGKDENEIEAPSVEGIEAINQVSVFNEDYVNQFVFQQDEVVNNSFEIFIKTKQYDQKMEEIEKLVLDIKETFKNDKRLEQVLQDLFELSNSFGKPAKNGIHGSAPINKALGQSGNKLNNIPDQLKAYTPFLQNPENVKWIDWQIKGNNFLEISDDCPYCTSSTAEKKDAIQAVSKEYDKKSIEHLNNILEVLENLGKYFSTPTKEKIDEIVNNPEALSQEAVTFLKGVWEQIDTLKDKLSDLKNISFFSFKDDDKIQDKIKLLKTDLTLLPHMEANETKNIIDSVNGSLDKLLENVGLLQGQINQQKVEIQRTIEKHKKDINDFLRYAGYHYYVDIEEDADSYKMRLKHKDFDSSISNSEKHLSYGERNAFSLVLFMYESFSKEADLIILDDPISSFDKNKKFAIIEMLFRGENSFRDKTVLMMTHDFEPIVDMISTLRSNFQPVPQAAFLQNNNGVMSEIQINKEDIVTFAQVCSLNIDSDNVNDIIKLIYLRRYYEILDDKGDEYHLLSNLFHKRENPVYGPPANDQMPQENILEATQKIQRKIPNFNYADFLELIQNDNDMLALYNSTENGYEKLQLFRIIRSDNQQNNNVVQKFINETFHIENEYVMQLNPAKYDFIPAYIISECDQALNAQE